MIPLISIFIVNELAAIWTKQIEATLIFDVHIFSSKIPFTKISYQFKFNTYNFFNCANP